MSLVLSKVLFKVLQGELPQPGQEGRGTSPRQKIKWLSCSGWHAFCSFPQEDSLVEYFMLNIKSRWKCTPVRLRIQLRMSWKYIDCVLFHFKSHRYLSTTDLDCTCHTSVHNSLGSQWSLYVIKVWTGLIWSATQPASQVIVEQKSPLCCPWCTIGTEACCSDLIRLRHTNSSAFVIIKTKGRNSAESRTLKFINIWDGLRNKHIPVIHWSWIEMQSRISGPTKKAYSEHLIFQWSDEIFCSVWR